MKRIIFTAITLLLGVTLCAQTITQTLRGIVVEADSRKPMLGVTIGIENANQAPTGTFTDAKGAFEIKGLTIGRYNISISFIGYKTLLLPNVLLKGGKETVLNIAMEESFLKLSEIVINANSQANKTEALNTMSFISSKMFTVDEAHKFAGGMDDPARLVTAFAGVSGGQTHQNGIVVRGNAPHTTLWTLEGVEIPNPNHFEGADMAGGGTLSAFSAQTLANSDFYMSAYPAEFGNATGGIFDMKLRTGNNQKRESGVQLSVLGLDAFSEGPLSKNKNASYLFNYRYATYSLIKNTIFAGDLSKQNLPGYQDLTLKLNFPTQKAGTFSIWGVGLLDELNPKDTDTTEWHNNEVYRKNININMNTGIVGLTHKISLSEKSFWNTTIAANATSRETTRDLYEKDGILQDYVSETYIASRYTLRTYLNHKFGKRHTNRTGIDLSNMYSDYSTHIDTSFAANYQTISSFKDNTWMLNAFTQSQLKLTEKLEANIGLHTTLITLNNEFVLEPRIGLQYQTGKNALSFGYGKHSRVNVLPLYFAEITTPTGPQTPNADLKLMKAHHFALSYDRSFGKYSHIKAELFYQYLYDVPVIPDSTYSVINFNYEYGMKAELVNDGLGKNYGIEFTYERFLHRGFYALATATLFKAKYKAGDGNWYNSRYDYGYTINALAGYEFNGKNKNNVWSTNIRLTTQGGERHSPFQHNPDWQYGDNVLDESQPFAERYPNTYYLDLTGSYTINKEKRAYEMGLMLKNIVGSKLYFPEYNYDTQTGYAEEVTFIYPNVFFKVNF